MNERISIVLMRHGRSRADDEQVHEGRYDSPLTELGRQQAAQRAADYLSRGFTFDSVIASPLQRARETAEIIASALHLPVETDPDWMEIDNGILAGLPFTETAVKYPRPMFRNPYEQIWGSGESEWEIYCRAARAVESLVRRGPGKRLVVAHGAVLNAALRAIAGAAPAVNNQGLVFSFGDTGYLRGEYVPSTHRWIMREFQPGFFPETPAG